MCPIVNERGIILSDFHPSPLHCASVDVYHGIHFHFMPFIYAPVLLQVILILPFMRVRLCVFVVLYKIKGMIVFNAYLKEI